MDLLLHYFDLSDDRVKVRFYDSHLDLMQQFKDLNPNHIYQISMDDPNLNLKFYDCIVKKREENEQHVLVDLVTCGVCTIHGTFKYGAEKSDWNSRKLSKNAIFYFMIAQLHKMIINLSLVLRNSHTVMLDIVV